MPTRCGTRRTRCHHIRYFETNQPLAHEIYSKLNAIQQGFLPLFDPAEVDSILRQGQCPEDLRESVTYIIRTASSAAYNFWVTTMSGNSEFETIAIFQKFAVFDPTQKAAFTFTDDELLEILRPIHDSIYGPC